jgi:hypothetical protein
MNSELVAQDTTMEYSLPSKESLLVQFASHEVAVEKILDLLQENFSLKNQFSKLQQSHVDLSAAHNILVTEKESLEQIRQQLRDEAQSILRDAQVLKLRNEQYRASCSSSNDTMDHPSNSSNRSISPILPADEGNNNFDSKKGVNSLAKRAFHVSTATQTDHVHASTKPYITMREKLLARDDPFHSQGSTPRDSNGDSLIQSSGSNSNHNNAVSTRQGISNDDGDETAFQATTFQDFIRMRREIIDLRARLQHLQQTPAGAISNISPTNAVSLRLPYSPRNLPNSTHSTPSFHGGRVSSGSVSSRGNTRTATGKSPSETIRIVSESQSQPAGVSVHSTKSDSNTNLSVALPQVKTLSPSFNSLSNSPVGFSSNGGSMFGQFLPKLHT